MALLLLMRYFRTNLPQSRAGLRGNFSHAAGVQPERAGFR